VSEPILLPDLVICDPHHHLWADPRPHDPRPYLPADLRADIASGHRVEQSVFVECKEAYRTDGPEAFRVVGETEFVVAADPEGLVAGIVGCADLRLPDISEILDAHVDAGAGRFRGVRQIASWHPDPALVSGRGSPPHLLADPAFRSGAAAVERAGLVFDASCYHTQIPEVADLASACPELRIVLEHLGSPLGIGPYAGRRAEVLREWREMMGTLVPCPNVAVKIGGIGMRTFGETWWSDPEKPGSVEVAARWGEEIRWCIETFGVDRCMFESNFPIDKLAFGYDVVWNAFKRTVIDGSPDELDALFRRTAVTVYGLDPVTRAAPAEPRSTGRGRHVTATVGEGREG
jgi:predicted TIM-barrel fold metal-dependent hydrolase